MGNFDPRTENSDSGAGRDLVLATIAEHASSLLSTARRYSLCADDAQDAYQRGLEIFLRHADGLQPQGAPAWLRTVIKHEALAVRAGRLRLVGPTEVDLDLEEARDVPAADERAASFERLERSAEALARLKPQEVRALVLKAHGYSYEEICEITGWTYTKVNRCLTEGRRAFRERFGDIEAGRECQRWSAVLCAVADGEASAQDLLALRPHLRRCPACRATLRALRLGNRDLAVVLPLALALPGTRVDDAPSAIVRLYEAVANGMHDRAAVSAQKLQAGVEATSAGKLAAIAASATALAGSGVAAVEGPLASGGKPGRQAHASQADRVAFKAAREPARPRRGDGGDGSHRRGHGERRSGRGRSGPAGESRRQPGSDGTSEFAPSAGEPSAPQRAGTPAVALAGEPPPASSAALDGPSSPPPSSDSSTSEFGP